MDSAPAPTPAEQIDLYWRRGCGFCAMLRRKLDQLGIDRVEHDIWAEPADAAVVRDHANGNETVPTVVIGDVGMVNPSAKQIIEYLMAEAPHLLPEGFEPPEPGPVERTLGRILG